MSEVKFSVFTDLHHLDGVFFTDAPDRLDSIRRRAIQNGVDFVIHCGDICHAPDQNAELLGQYARFPMPTYHCIGNHECEYNTFEQVLTAFGLEKGYYYFDKKGIRFIVLDLNYMRVDGVAVHYDMGNYFKPYPNKQKVTMTDEQLDWLEQTVMSSPYPCVLFSHQSLERVNNGMSLEELHRVWSMFDRVNGDRQRIILAVNGHHHKDNLRIFKGIAFLDLNSASYDWVNTAHSGKYPQQLYDRFSLVCNTLVWEDPIHAIVTVCDNGSITIEGMNSRYIYDTDRASIGVPVADEDGRLGTPNVLSAQLKLDMTGLLE